jgi:Peptidase family M23
MTCHRTTARGVVFLFCLLGLVAAVAAASAQGLNNGTVGKQHKRIIFPLLGRTTYTDNYGDPRPIGTEQGIDIMKPRKSIVLAAEAGRVKFETDSGAGCMLYLYGHSGTTYLYIHLNNDKTSHNDNRGKCGPGMSYAPHLHNGAHVKAGQVIAFSGDSGNASGTPHLEFQVRPHDGRPVDPYAYLNKGRRFLFSTLPGPTVKVALIGKVVKVEDQFLTMRVRSLVASPGKLRVQNVSRSVTVYVPVDAVISARIKGERGTTATVSLAAAKKDRGLTLTTTPAAPTLDLMLGRPDTLTAKRILLAAPK